MNTYTLTQDPIVAIFDHGAQLKLTREEEFERVHLLRTYPHTPEAEQAALELLYAYAPTLRNAVARRPFIDREDARSVVVTRFYELVADLDPSKGARLASVVLVRLLDALDQYAETVRGLTVAAETARKIIPYLREAYWDATEAYELYREAGESHYSPATFRDVAAAHNLQHLDLSAPGAYESDAAPLWDYDGGLDADDKLLADAALSVLDAEQLPVVRYAYGFEHYGEPQSDAAVGHYLGKTRRQVQHVRTRALDDMRAALGVA